MDEVILVDEQDNEVGSMEKLRAHKEGLLHRAFSVFIFNSEKELLLQRRAKDKYHSGGLWTNSCCSHPLLGETILEAAHRRVKEELGMSVEAEKRFSFLYRAEFENNLVEHELDHVTVAYSDEEPRLNPEEADEWKYVDLDELRQDAEQNPEAYTAWLKIILSDHFDQLNP